MKATIPANTYKAFALWHEKTRKMSQSAFVRWCRDFYANAYRDGWDDAKKDCNVGGVSVPDDVDAQVLDADILYEELLKIRGIGPRTADKVMELIGGRE